jgi:hypothetical protein
MQELGEMRKGERVQRYREALTEAIVVKRKDGFRPYAAIRAGFKSLDNDN